MSCILNERFNKNIVYIVLINITTITSYKIGAALAIKWGLLFRGWIDILYIINLLVLTIIIITFINVFLCSKIRKNPLKIISSLITAIIIVIVCVYGVVILAFSYAPEHTVYEQNQEVIAKVFSVGLLHTQVNFYEPVNIFLMRKSNIPSKFYDGSYDMYKKRQL